MDQYVLLLEAIGIFDHGIEKDFVEPRVDDLETIFPDSNSCQYTDYHLDYSQEIDLMLNGKKKHRYSRKSRFKNVLLQLLGERGHTPARVINIIIQNLKLKPKLKKSNIWNAVRKILKKQKIMGFYNKIPHIIARTTGCKPKGVTYDRVQHILQDFSDLHYQFNNHLANRWSRKYFPNLRFVALKLMAKHGIVFPYHVPLVRTVRKRKYLESLYAEFSYNVTV